MNKTVGVELLAQQLSFMEALKLFLSSALCAILPSLGRDVRAKLTWEDCKLGLSPWQLQQDWPPKLVQLVLLQLLM